MAKRVSRRSGDAGSMLMGATALATVLGAFTLGGADGAHAHAQMPDREIAEIVRDYAIPAGRMSTALTRLADASGVVIVYDTSLTRSLTTHGLEGAHTLNAALRKLLSGSGLNYEVAADGKSVLIVLAQNDAVRNDAGGAEALPTIDIGAEKPSPKRSLPPPGRATELAPAYAGGQVAAGARLGFLGNRSTLDTPFNVIGYTSELAKNQTARSVADIVANDPSARAIFPRASYRDVFTIRGFNLFTYNIAYGGLLGVLPKQRIVPEIAERIEILKGPDTFVNGVTVGGTIGGNINIVPKRATDEPITDLTLGFVSKGQPSAHLDYGRRFGEDKEFGVRFNGVFRKGEVAVDGERERIGTTVLGLDYRGEDARFSVDVGYQIQKVNSPDWVLTLGTATGTPLVPRNTKNLSQPWAYTETEDNFIAVRGEYDLTKSWTVFASFASSHTGTSALVASPTLLQANGDFTVNRFTFPSGGLYTILETGVRGRFETGPITHNVTVVGTIWDQNLKAAANFFTTAKSNIYYPTLVAAPNTLQVPSLASLRQTAGNFYSGAAFADTLSAFDDRVLLTLGGRFQRIQAQSANGVTGLQTALYNDSAISPAIGAVVKIRDDVALYANYVQGLQQGPSAPSTAVNFGQAFPPAVAKQIETGVKADWGKWTSTLGVFEITQANGVTDPASLVFSANGQQRNRGLEFNLFGEPIEGLRILGGFALIEGVQTKTAGKTLDGKRAIGVPDRNVNIGAEVDVPFLPDLALSGRMINTSAQYVNAANTQAIPGWTRFDLGARYRLRQWEGKPVTLRFNVENLFDKDYYASAATGQVTGVSRGAPRTFIGTATFSF